MYTAPSGGNIVNFLYNWEWAPTVTGQFYLHHSHFLEDDLTSN